MTSYLIDLQLMFIVTLMVGHIVAIVVDRAKRSR